MTGNDTPTFFSTITDPDELASHLANKVSLQGSRSIALGVHAGRRSVTTVLESPGPALKPGAALVLPSSCLTQLFTATLIMLAAREGRLSLDEEVHTLLPAATRYRDGSFRQVAVRHLLNHTSGLDCWNVEDHVSRRPDGRIDATHLCARLGEVPQICEPGSMYRYGRAGPYLAAAILEALFDQSFEQLLVRQLFEPLGMELNKPPVMEGPICPAYGSNLSVSTHDLMKFLTWHLAQSQSEADHCGSLAHMAAMYQDVVSISGWHLERGSGLGWRWYGNDWFGHAAPNPVGSIVVRLNVKHQIAFALMATDDNALQVTAQLFGSVLPEFASLKFPPRLTEAEVENLDFGQFVGCYQDAAISMQVTRENRRCLRALTYSRNNNSDSQEPIWKALLHPFRNELFLTEPRPNDYNPFTHFSHPTSSGYRYMQYGQHLLRRRESVT